MPDLEAPIAVWRAMQGPRWGNGAVLRLARWESGAKWPHSGPHSGPQGPATALGGINRSYAGAGQRAGRAGAVS